MLQTIDSSSVGEYVTGRSVENAQPVPMMSRSTLQEGVNLLFDFQLRKENAALLERAHAHTKHLEQLKAETDRNRRDFEERMAALEATLLEIKNDESRDRHDCTKHCEDMTALKSQIGGVVDKLETHERQLTELRVENEKIQSPSLQLKDKNFTDATETSSRTPGTTSSLKVTQQQPPSSSKTLKVVAEPTDAPVIEPGSHSHNQLTHISSDFAGPTTRHRSRSRSRSRSVGDNTPHQTQLHIPTPTTRQKATRPSSRSKKNSKPTLSSGKLPRLHQGTGPLSSYLDKATSTFHSLAGPKDQKFQIGFIAAFIKGVRDADKREVLVEELQQQHQSRTKKDGKIEILCKWEDVGEVMEAAGLLAASDVRTESKPKSHKSKLEKELQSLRQ